MILKVILRAFGTNETIDFGDISLNEDFSLSTFFEGANGYGPYAWIRDRLPRSFSAGDAVYFDVPLICPFSGDHLHYHICEPVGWYSCAEPEFLALHN